ncbi:hypothetical protein VCSRO206_3425 [Vibrio cholerae]|nr:hypothetical protein VCSRO206_3425 [Vibrio cholerae]
MSIYLLMYQELLDTKIITINLRGIHNAWHFCFYFKFSGYGTML